MSKKKVKVATAPKRAVLVARVEYVNLRQAHHRLEQQLREGRNYASAMGFSVVAELVMGGRKNKDSSRLPNRLQSYITETGKQLAVVAETPHRLYRNPHDMVQLDQLVMSGRIELHLFGEGAVINQQGAGLPSETLGMNTIIGGSGADRKTIGRSPYCANQDIHSIELPAGYVYDQATRRISMDPLKAPLVRHLFELYATGDWTKDALASLVADDGLWPSDSRHPGEWASRVEDLLRNTFYVGELRWKGTVYDGRHEPLVSSALFEQVQAMIRKGK